MIKFAQNLYLMKQIFTVFLGIFCGVLVQAQSFQQKQTNVGRIGLNITNVGTMGLPNVRNNTQGPPSMEYPLNSGIEHLFEGGLWLGAKVNGQTLVSTATLDDPTGYTNPGKSGYEYTSVSNLTERSKLANSNFYSNTAVSHQDFVCSFTDKNIIVPGTNIPIADHTLPLGADVKLETYTWNYSFADYFVIANYEITNNSLNKWDSVWLGFWTDLVVRNVNVTQDDGTAFFNKGGGGFLDSLKALYAYQVLGDDINFTQSYGSTQFLGIEWRNQFVHPNNNSVLLSAGYPAAQVNANFWDFRTVNGTDYGAPGDDAQRYFKLSKGLDFITDPTSPSSPNVVLKSASNKTQLLSVGPLVSVNPGETFRFVLAFVCAKQVNGPQDNTGSRVKLLENLGWAKRTYLGEDLNENGKLDTLEDLNGDKTLNRYILPEPPATPKTKLISGDGKVEIYWSDNAERSVDPISKLRDFEGYRIYRSNIGEDKNLNLLADAKMIAQWDSAGNSNGFNNGFSTIRLPQARFFDGDTTSYWYKYELTGMHNGWQYLVVLTSFDKGDASVNLPSLESSLTENSYSLYTGADENPFDGNEKEVGVYPNPYVINAAWDGSTSRTRKIYFTNLPARCEIVIYTSAGDVLTSLFHDAADGQIGNDIRWYSNYSGSGTPVYPKGEHAWDLLSESKTGISQGIYLYAVKDLETGEIRRGNFAVIK